MAFQDFLLRARRPASLIACNRALPVRFKLLHKPSDEWLPLLGVNLDPIENLTLKDAILDRDDSVTTPAILSPDTHYNLRVTDEWSGWRGLNIPDDDSDSKDARLRGSEFRRWFKRHGVERRDKATRHPRSGRDDMLWDRWTDGEEWLDLMIDEPRQRRRVWL